MHYSILYFVCVYLYFDNRIILESYLDQEGLDLWVVHPRVALHPPQDLEVPLILEKLMQRWQFYKYLIIQK